MQSDPGNSYMLEAENIDVAQYLGQQVEVTGVETHSQSTSAHSVREGGGSSLTIRVDSINSLSKRCSH
jgi:hypothetical protein